MRNGHTGLQQGGVDFLAHALLDACLDSFFPELDHLGDQLDSFDEQATEGRTPVDFHQIHLIRHELLQFRRIIRPHRDMVNELVRDDCMFVTAETRVFLRDCFDHVIQLLDIVESYRELAADLRDFQMSLTSNRLNNIMRVLTVLSTLFLPMTFVTGLYGMNFDTTSAWNMPELHWRFGYLFSFGLMAIFTLGMMLYFRKRGML